MNSSVYVNGYYGFENTDTPQDREKELSELSGGRFRRIPGNGHGKSFADLAASIGKRCVRVIDWEGSQKPCSDGAHDGSRMAYCESSFDPGFYAYEKTSTPQDREKELNQLSNNRLIRLKGFDGGNFKGLCEKIGHSCIRVIDWQGKELKCTNPASDGSRMVECGAAPKEKE